MNLNIDLGKNFLIKIFRKDISETTDLTGTKSCISSVKRNIQRAASDSHNGIGCFFQKFIVSILTDGYGISYFISKIPGKETIQKDLTAFFRDLTLVCCEKIEIVAE